MARKHDSQKLGNLYKATCFMNIKEIRSNFLNRLAEMLVVKSFNNNKKMHF